MPFTTALISLLSTQVLTTTAEPPLQHRHQVGVNLGVFSPTGALGLTYAMQWSSRLALQAGAGLSELGLHLAALPRFTYGERHVLFAGLGPSATFADRAVLWANAEGGYQFRARRLFVEAGLGYGLIVAGDTPEPCLAPCDTAGDEIMRRGDGLPSFRLASGIRF